MFVQNEISPRSTARQWHEKKCSHQVYEPLGTTQEWTPRGRHAKDGKYRTKKNPRQVEQQQAHGKRHLAHRKYSPVVGEGWAKEQGLQVSMMCLGTPCRAKPELPGSRFTTLKWVTDRSTGVHLAQEFPLELLSGERPSNTARLVDSHTLEVWNFC